MTFADKMAELAVRALITEVCITPKPGLVDRANNGAHRDMNVFTFIDSALTLHGYFRCITSLSQTHEDDGLLLKLQPLGLQAEQDMFRVTKGVNTHKGAIFSLGLICAAAAVLERQSIKQTDEILSQTCADIVRSRSRLRDAEKAAEKGAATKGELVYKRHGLRGILGEAAAGFPAVFEIALPVLRKFAPGRLEDAAVAALIHLIACLDDTNIISRCGLEALRELQARVKNEISNFTDISQYLSYAHALDDEFISRNISPGGCADLLAAALLVYYML